MHVKCCYGGNTCQWHTSEKVNILKYHYFDSVSNRLSSTQLEQGVCLLIIESDNVLKSFRKGFPGGSMVKNLPANAGDTGSVLDLERSHMPLSNKARGPQLLSLCSRAQELQLLNPCSATTEPREQRALSRARAPQQEKPPQWEASALRLERSPCLLKLRKSQRSNEDPAQSKINK